MTGVMLGRQDEVTLLKPSDNPRTVLGMRPEVDLVGREDGEQERGETAAQEGRKESTAEIGSEPPSDCEHRYQNEADVAVDLDQIVASDQHRVVMMLAKRMDE